MAPVVPMMVMVPDLDQQVGHPRSESGRARKRHRSGRMRRCRGGGDHKDSEDSEFHRPPMGHLAYGGLNDPGDASVPAYVSGKYGAWPAGSPTWNTLSALPIAV